MLNPTAWGWGAKAGFFWAGTAVVGVLWSWRRLPETRGRGFAEIDCLFREGVRARWFKEAVVVVREGGAGVEGAGEREGERAEIERSVGGRVV